MRLRKRRRVRQTRQAELNFDAGKHGGKRKGSGRPEGPNPKLWHRSPARVLDPASSARWFHGWREGAKVDRSPPSVLRLGSGPAVAARRTWLLRVGWRRHRLIDPSEIPGGAHA